MTDLTFPLQTPLPPPAVNAIGLPGPRGNSLHFVAVDPPGNFGINGDTAADFGRMLAFVKLNGQWSQPLAMGGPIVNAIAAIQQACQAAQAAAAGSAASAASASTTGAATVTAQAAVATGAAAASAVSAATASIIAGGIIATQAGLAAAIAEAKSVPPLREPAMQALDILRGAVLAEWTPYDASGNRQLLRCWDDSYNLLYDSTAAARGWPAGWGNDQLTFPAEGFEGAAKGFTNFGAYLGFIFPDRHIRLAGKIGPADVDTDTTLPPYINAAGALCAPEAGGEREIIPAAAGPVLQCEPVASKPGVRKIVKRHGACALAAPYYLRELPDRSLRAALAYDNLVMVTPTVGQSNAGASEAFDTAGTYTLPAPYATTYAPNTFFLTGPAKRNLDCRNGLARGSSTGVERIVASEFNGLVRAKGTAGISNVHGLSFADVVALHEAERRRDEFGVTPPVIVSNVALGGTRFGMWKYAATYLMGGLVTPNWRLIDDYRACLDASRTQAQAAFGKAIYVPYILAGWGESDAGFDLEEVYADLLAAMADLTAETLSATGQLVPPVFVMPQPCVNNAPNPVRHSGALAILRAAKAGKCRLSAPNYDAPRANLAAASPHYSAAGAIETGDQMLRMLGAALAGAPAGPPIPVMTSAGNSLIFNYTTGGQGGPLLLEPLTAWPSFGAELWQPDGITPISIASVTQTGARQITVAAAEALTPGCIAAWGQQAASPTQLPGNGVREAATFTGASGAQRIIRAVMSREAVQ